MNCIAENCNGIIFVKSRQLCKSCYNKQIRLESLDKYKESERNRKINARNNNPEKYKEIQRKFYYNNIELVRSKSRKDYNNRREAILKQTKQYQQTENYKKSRKFIKAKRRANKLKATPKWADLEAIKEFYKNCPEGHHVDHIIPLVNNFVCGLHVIENLQYLTIKENLSKNNKFDWTLANNSWRNTYDS